MALPRTEIVIALFDSYLAIRENALLDTKLKTVTECVQFIEKNNSTRESWTTVSNMLSEKAEAENKFMEESRSGMLAFIFKSFNLYQKPLLLETLFTAQAYVASFLTTKDEEVKKFSAEIEAHFNEVIKLYDPQSKSLNENSFDDFKTNVLNQKRTLSHYKKRDTLSVSAEEKSSEPLEPASLTTSSSASLSASTSASDTTQKIIQLMSATPINIPEKETPNNTNMPKGLETKDEQREQHTSSKKSPAHDHKKTKHHGQRQSFPHKPARR